MSDEKKHSASSLITHHSSLITGSLNSAPLRRAAAVVRYGRRVADGEDADAGVVDGADGGFAPAARPLDVHLALLHAGVLGLVGRLVGRLLGGERSALARAAEAAGARGGLRDEVALVVRDRDQRVVERRRDVNDPRGDVLLLFLPKDLLLAACC